MSRIVVSYNDEWYDVTKFNHPGDGIKGLNLADFHGKKIDVELHEQHYTNDPYEMLEEAKKNGHWEEIIFYLGKDKNAQPAAPIKKEK